MPKYIKYNRNPRLKAKVDNIKPKNQVVIFDTNNQPVYNNWDTEKAIKEGFNSHAIVYRCVREQATTFGGVRIFVKNISSEKEIPNHPAMELLNKPFPKLSKFKFQEQVNGFLNIAGDFYAQKLFVGSKLAGMLPLPPNRITIIPNSKGELIYKYTFNGNEKYLLEYEIFHHKAFNPGSTLYGISPMKAASREIDTDSSAASWNNSSMNNQGRPSGILSTEGELNDEQFERIKGNIKKYLSGHNNARSPLLLEGGLTWQQTSMSPAELDFMAGRKLNASYIVIVYRMDLESIGLGNATYENKKQAEINLWNKAIIPDIKDYVDSLNTQIMSDFDDNHIFSFDISGSPPALESENRKLDQAEKYKSLGYTTNQINKKLNLGMEEVPWGDTIYVPLSLVPISETLNPTPLPDVPANKSFITEVKAFNLTTEKQISSYIKQQNKKRRAWNKTIESQVRKRFNVEKAVVLEAIKNGSRDLDKTIDGQKKIWEKLIKASWKVIVQDFGQSFADNVNNKMVKYVFDPYEREVDEYISKYSANDVVDITNTTKVKIRNQIVASSAEAETVKELSDRIVNLYDEHFSKYRAIVIARTETKSSSGYGTRLSALQSKIMETKKWITSGQDRVRDSHEKMNGEERKMNELYSNGLMYPGDPLGSAEEVIQCMCDEIYFTKKGN